LTEDEHQFLTVAKREPPTRRCEEIHICVGRKAGKSKIVAALACYLAIEDHELSPRETGHIVILAADREQAKTLFDFAVAYFEESPILRQWVESKTRDEIRLTNRVVIGVYANSFRSIRGRTMLAVCADELAFGKTRLLQTRIEKSSMHVFLLWLQQKACG